MTTKRALVLAGGGLAGIAWETGILQGIADESPATAEALISSDVLLGTSAGSTVSAQLSSGLSLDELYQRQVAADSHEIRSGVDIDSIFDLFLTAMSDAAASREQKLVRIGEIALATPTVEEKVRHAVIEHRLPSHDWPDTDLRITAIDIATGELLTFDRDSGVGLVDAVAASCAVPGAWPPVTIGDRRYMDGGVGSTVNMSLVEDCAVAVVLVPSGETTPSPLGGGAAAEVALFAGRAFGVFADDEALAAFGPDPLDPACRVPSARAGRNQGRRYAAPIAEFLAG
ncbi:patatin-like phospholipase family protein [Micromonospora sp. WMMD736]|uniref:patatin-like phospholipase family protein n=1 Tax=Micromonospora sp. WMMD736 TaxID=3404112 RepID=UPI003B923F40